MIEIVDLPGHAELHKSYHQIHGTTCGRDCMYYEDIGEELEAKKVKFLHQAEANVSTIHSFYRFVFPALVLIYGAGVVTGLLLGWIFWRANVG